MSGDHEVIYLQPACQCGDERLWCSADQGPCEDCGAPWVMYRRVPPAVTRPSEPRTDIVAGDGDEAGEIEGEPR